MSDESGSRPIASLDGLRAVSFLVVFVGHAGIPHNPFPGDLGVTVFFLLSGYLITTLMRREYDAYHSVNLGAFYSRRALRILPPLYLTLIIACLVAVPVYGPGRLQVWPMTALAFNVGNYWIAAFGSGGMVPGAERYWSLGVEEHFYLLYPWLYLALRRWGLSGRQQAAALWALCALMLLWRCLLVYVIHAPAYYILLASETRGDLLLFGCALGVWANPAFEPSRLPGTVWKWRIVPLCLLALLLTLRCFNAHFRQTWYFTLQGLALSPLLMAAIRFPDWWLFRWLSWRPVAVLGVLSYAMYLIHDVCLRALAQLWPDVPRSLRMVPAFAASLLIAVLVHVLVERPFARWRRRLRRGAGSGPLPSEAVAHADRYELLPIAVGANAQKACLHED